MTSDNPSEPHDAGALPPGEHRRILARYRSTWTGTGWHTAPDDGYLYVNLTYHLAALAATDPDAAHELQSLFADHHWLHARVTQAGSKLSPLSDARFDGYLEDLARYWGTVQRDLLGELAAGKRCAALVDGIWCALLASSVAALTNGGAAVTTPEDVEFDMWSGLLAHDVPISLLDAGRKADVLLSIPPPSSEPPAPPPAVAQLFITPPSVESAPSPSSYLVVCSAYGKTYQEWWSFDEHESELQLF